jgi:hypothetical protein
MDYKRISRGLMIEEKGLPESDILSSPHGDPNPESDISRCRHPTSCRPRKGPDLGHSNVMPESEVS